MIRKQLKDSRELYNWIRGVIAPNKPLGDLLDQSPILSSEMPEVGNALVRADIDVPIANNRVTDTARLESISNTLHLLWGNNIVPILFGHVGRVSTNSARPIADALSSIYDCKVKFIPEWFSDETYTELSYEFVNALKTLENRSLILLENTRKYKFEQHLWGKSPDTLSDIDIDLLSIPAQTLIQASPLYVSDAIASSNPDWSSLVLPFYAHHSFLAQPVAKEFKQYILPCTNSNVLIFSGLKADKLDDLERITASGLIKFVIVGGALAFPFLVLKGTVVEDEKHPLLNSQRVRQAGAIIESINNSCGTITLPIDFIDSAGKVCKTASAPSDMLDIGPKTILAISKNLINFVKSTPAVSIYMNGVLGKVEDVAFQTGTVSMFKLFHEVKALGAKIFIGGGDGAAAFRKFGDEADVDHVFTAGGTVLKAMSGRPISYLSSIASLATNLNRDSTI